MLKNIVKKALLLQLVLGSATVFANTYTFSQITTNGATPVASQLSANVTQSGSNVLFTFTNSSVVASSITDVYFDYGNTSFFALGNTGISNNILGAAGDSAGVSFSDGANPSDLPGGGMGFSAEASGDSNTPGVTANGVNSSTEFVKFLGTTLTGITFADVIAGLDSGAFRLGLHVQAINGGTSESFINNPSAVPVPAALPLLASALGAFGIARRRNKAKAV